jgi:uncharacterized integral membrane protein
MDMFNNTTQPARGHGVSGMTRPADPPTRSLSDSKGSGDVDQSQRTQHPKRTRAGGLWAGLIVAAFVLIVLLVFIVQNNNVISVYFILWEIALPIGVAMLLAAVAGLLIVAIPGTSRIVQLRRAARSGPRR